MEIRSRDSFIIPLMIEENRAKFFTVSLRVPLEQGLPQGCKGLIVISLCLSRPKHAISLRTNQIERFGIRLKLSIRFEESCSGRLLKISLVCFVLKTRKL